MTDTRIYDVIIGGGGFAGLTAALWLGRYRRDVLVISSGPSRNAKSHAVHGYPGFDGGNPGQLLETLRTEALAYGSELQAGWVSAIVKHGEDNFSVTTKDGDSFRGRRVLLATGKTDVKPDIAGFDDYDGVSAWHCPACDGHEYSDKKIAVVGWGEQIAGYIMELRNYSQDVVLLTDSHVDEVSSKARHSLKQYGVSVHDTAITSLAGSGGQIETVHLGDGTALSADALFYSIRHQPRLDLLEKLGCEMKDDCVAADAKQATCVAGVYVAGDIAPLEELVVVACAMGAVAASNIHASLM